MKCDLADDRAAERGHQHGMRHRAPFALLFLLACAAESAPPSIVGQPDDRAAAIATEVACEYVDRCGDVSITCADCDGEGDCGGCEVEIREVTYDQCSDVALPQLTAGFACMTLTADEESAVDACLQALGDWSCPDVDGDDPAALPDGCDVLEDIRYRCAEDVPHTGTGMSPTPAD